METESDLAPENVRDIEDSRAVNEVTHSQEQTPRPSLDELLKLYMPGDIHIHPEQPLKLKDGVLRPRSANISLTDMERYTREQVDKGTGRVEYLVATPHSSDSDVQRPQGEKKIAELLAHIADVRTLEAKNRAEGVVGPKLYAGIETDLIDTENGTDLPTDLLRKFDLVIASENNEDNLDIDIITAKYLKAMDNPDVDVIGHPQRNFTEETMPQVAWDKIFKKAAETHTAIELNGKPPAPPAWFIQKAVASGAPLMIGTDFHNLLRFGNLPGEDRTPTEEEQSQFKDLPAEERKKQNDERLQHPPGFRFWYRLAPILKALYDAGAQPEQVISSSRERLDDWLSKEKAER